MAKMSRRPRPLTDMRSQRLLVEGDAHRKSQEEVCFANFTGRTVLHCHILNHEDAGMMAVLEIVK